MNDNAPWWVTLILFLLCMLSLSNVLESISDRKHDENTKQALARIEAAVGTQAEDVK